MYLLRVEYLLPEPVAGWHVYLELGYSDSGQMNRKIVLVRRNLRNWRPSRILLLTHKFPNPKNVNVFGHRTMKVSHPVRSAVNKHRIAWLVLQWVTMWESQVLNSV